MRGGVARWKRGVNGHGLRAATAYALGGVCDASHAHSVAASGVDNAAGYADESVTRWVLNDARGGVRETLLDRRELREWVAGSDPETGEVRGRVVSGANADLVFDATVNTPKSLSIAAMLDSELAAGVEALHDRIRDRAMRLWLDEMNGRRGAGGRNAVGLAQIEVVELHHARSRALDPHAHRHLWLNAKVLCADGKWSNVDSRALLRFQTIVNAEGDLAASCDPEWRALLAAKGLSVDSATGEIMELSHLVAPLSRRAKQIDAARATKLEQWHKEHPGMTPTAQDLRAIDQWAWAYGRPGKPKRFDEEQWREQVLDEIRGIDPGMADRLRDTPVVSHGMPTLSSVTGMTRDNVTVSQTGATVTFGAPTVTPGMTSVTEPVTSVTRDPDTMTNTVTNDSAMTHDIPSGIRDVTVLSGGVSQDVTQLDTVALVRATLAEADRRSTSVSGRFSQWDVRGCAIRAIAATGVVADRDTLETVVEEVTQLASTSGMLVDLVGGDDVPGHVRRFVMADTVTLKNRVSELMAQLSQRDTGVNVNDSDVTLVASQVSEHGLDKAQRDAAGAIAGTAGLVTVVGPAGAGKTTMLTVARHLMAAQDKKMFIVAPTKKAALVAGRETGAKAASIHSLLYQYGWRWEEDAYGKTVWQKLAVGSIDPATGKQWYPAPELAGMLDRNTRIVVDEAGMLDLEAAKALSELAVETGCTVALVGDPQQVMPVGHSGAMAMAMRTANQSIELESIHRFRTENGSPDKGWAELSRKLRQPESAATARAVADELIARGRVHTVDNTLAAETLLADKWLAAYGAGETAAVVVATNEEARGINDAIQQRRVDLGQIKDKRTATGMGGQRLLVGDTVQTRRNDKNLGVDNRALWRVVKITGDNLVLEAQDTDRSRRIVPKGYAAEAVQLAYATTAHGIQGETVTRSIVSGTVDAAGLYVGLTRGKRSNDVVVVAGSQEKAAEQLVSTITRGDTEISLADSRAAALRELNAAAMRNQATYHVKPWQQRPYGYLMGGIDERIEQLKQEMPFKRVQVQAVADKVEALRHEFDKSRRESVTVAATSDLSGRDKADARLLEAETYQARLATQIDEAKKQLDEMHKANKEVGKKLDWLIAEKNVRELVLTPQQVEAETRSRQECTEQRSRNQSMPVDRFTPATAPVQVTPERDGGIA